MRINRRARVCLMAALFFVATDFGARAQSPQAAAQSSAQAVADVFHEAESKYMFGFTDGADIGNEGEMALEYESTGSFQKRGGRYAAIEHELAFEHVLTQNFSYEVSAHGLTHSIGGVEDLDDRNSTQFSGLSAKLRYLIIGRGPGSPFGLTVSAEPEWSRIDGTDGTQTRSYASEFKVVADTELIANRLYAAINLIYEPEVAKPADSGMWERSSSAGVGMGLAYRITPTFAMASRRNMTGPMTAWRCKPSLAMRSLSDRPCRSISPARCCWPRRFRLRLPATPLTIRGHWTSRTLRAIAAI